MTSEDKSDVDALDDVRLVVVVTEVGCSRAIRIYQALETVCVAVALFAVTMHMLLRMGAVVEIEKQLVDDPSSEPAMTFPYLVIAPISEL